MRAPIRDHVNGLLEPEGLTCREGHHQQELPLAAGGEIGLDTLNRR